MSGCPPEIAHFSSVPEDLVAIGPSPGQGLTLKAITLTPRAIPTVIALPGREVATVILSLLPLGKLRVK